jgi:hypothetical protein
MTRLRAGHRAVLAAFALAAPLSAQGPDVRALVTGEPPGVRQTERLADKADRLIAAVEETQREVRATLASHDALVHGSFADLRKPYRELDRAIERCDRAREKARRRAEEARAESTDYYRAWAGSLPLIEDEDLRTRSEARLRASRGRFGRSSPPAVAPPTPTPRCSAGCATSGTTSATT